METWERPDTWWCAAGAEAPFAAWLADRCAVDSEHLVAVAEVGRDGDGRLVAVAAELSGVPLPDALDRIGVLTAGVAVTLSLPLLELAGLAVRGALLLGALRVDDVLVDDSGAVVVVDRPPGTGLSGPVGVLDGADALVLAVRSVWDRVDPREPCVRSVEEACRAAGVATIGTVDALADAVRAAAAPRPVRWDPPPATYAFSSGDTTDPSALDGVGRTLAWCRDALDRGLRVRGHRIRLRTLVTVVVVVVGLVVALTTTGGGRGDTRTAPPPTRGVGAVVVADRAGGQYPRFGAKLPSSRRFFTATRYRDASAPSMIRWS